ncbi:MAG: lamin tail domain-containing protein [Verrucomicrobiota bacterium]|nr:lamin tail domain-containing protein [Verrucomicrobiota bacterium]
MRKSFSLLLLCGIAFFPFTASAQPIVINEVLANNRSYPVGGFSTDWVEIHNPGSLAVNLSGAGLSDDPLFPRRWTFPGGTAIAPGGFLLVLMDAGQPASTSANGQLNSGFGLKASGDRLYLHNIGNDLIDSVIFGAQALDFSIGRAAAGGTWGLNLPTPGAVNVSQPGGSSDGIKINEWMASPSSGDDWFELYNPGNQPVALGGLSLSDKLDLRLFTIPSLSYIGTGPGAYLQFFASEETNKGPTHVNFKLGAGGDSIGLFSARGPIDTVTFGAQSAGISEGRLPDGSGTIRPMPNTESPAKSNFITHTGLVVSEILSHTDPPLEDAVEFFNTTAHAIDISGWYLSNSDDDLKRYVIPQGTIVPPNGYAVIYEGAFNGASALVPFTFNSAHGDQVYLSEVVNGHLTGQLVSETFEAAENGVSFGRHQTSLPGDYKFVAMAQPTFGVSSPSSVAEFRLGTGAPNSAPRVGPVILNEIMYRPPGSAGVNNVTDEFIELYNLTASSVALYDPLNPANSWRLQNGVEFTFPPFTTINPLSYLLVVSFNPSTNATFTSQFRSKYGIPDGVQILGPYSGSLSDGGEEIELYKPDPPQAPGQPDAGFIPHIRVDKLNYDDAAPWPTGADGTGNSLQRKNSLAFGNDPLSWEAAASTAGKANSSAVADSDSDGVPDEWEIANQFNPNNSSDAALDTDQDSHSNLKEYVAGTNPRDVNSVLKLQQWQGFANTNQPFLLRFTAVANKSYSIQYLNTLTTNLAGFDWKKLKDIPAESSNRLVEIADTNAATRFERYYRIITPSAD